MHQEYRSTRMSGWSLADRGVVRRYSGAGSVILLIAAVPLGAVTVHRGVLSTDVNEETCSARTAAAKVFHPTDRQIFVGLTASRISAGDELRIDWVDPHGNVEQSAPYAELPAAPSLCFVSQLPVSGFPASANPGEWTVRAVSHDRVIWSETFRMESDGNTDAVRVTAVARVASTGDSSALLVDGAGFEAGSIVHVAEYRKDGGWRYLHSVLPTGGSANRLTAKVPALGAGEYFILVRNADGATSKPARLLVSTGGRYRLPIAGGERWIITQGPYGSFSHWRNSLHAYDIAPRSGQWITAMQAGIAYAHDLRMRQNHLRRTFGNYITIQHDNGEFSHYGHLATGTFLVKTGDRVEAGQPLARVGNSGYTLGEGGGYHVHVHVTKTMPVSSPSIPFKFDELTELAVTRLRGLEVRSNAAPIPAEVLRRASPARHDAAGPGTTLSGTVQVAATWSDIVTVPAKTKAVNAELQWGGAERDLDLHLVSPSGHHYGWYGDTTGYSGQKSTPEKFLIDNPEPGPWRVMVAGMGGASEPIPFEVCVAMTGETPARRPRARSHRRASLQASVRGMGPPGVH
jgi:murein DD-endopeptidase MepM/ murein hydrolase activator NlpD